MVEYDSHLENPLNQASESTNQVTLSTEKSQAPVPIAPALNFEKLANLTNTPIMTLRLDTLDKSKTFQKTNRQFKHAEIIKSK